MNAQDLTTALERSIQSVREQKRCAAIGSQKWETPEPASPSASLNRQQSNAQGAQHTMSLRIIRSTEPVPVEHPIFLIYGQPGLGKSSIAFSAGHPIVLNFDSESALCRTVNRRDALNVL